MLDIMLGYCLCNASFRTVRGARPIIIPSLTPYWDAIIFSRYELYEPVSASFRMFYAS
jgi:hypothetical protein